MFVRRSRRISFNGVWLEVQWIYTVVSQNYFHLKILKPSISIIDI